MHENKGHGFKMSVFHRRRSEILALILGLLIGALACYFTISSPFNFKTSTGIMIPMDPFPEAAWRTPNTLVIDSKALYLNSILTSFFGDKYVNITRLYAH
jgi:hypothetical protein